MPNNHFDVIIIGGGVTGTAALYVLSQYTDIPRIALIEKYSSVASVNSHFNNNSQTLHFGDIETNYTVEKARRVKEGAAMVAHYVERHGTDLFNKTNKMVLAVGQEQVEKLEQRFDDFAPLFPHLKKIDRHDIAALEPNIVNGRDPNEPIMALSTHTGYAVNFQALSESFVTEAQHSQADVKLFLNQQVTTITRQDNHFTITTNEQQLTADVVLVCAGSHSLPLAQQMGYCQHIGLLPVAGSFYTANNLLNGKVYTMQKPKLPFAAVHGDPDVNDPTITRFGPTAKLLPMLERRNYDTVWEFLRIPIIWRPRGILTLLKISFDPILLGFIIWNLLFEIPFLGTWLFLQDVQKIIPAARYRDLRFEKNLGGVRPQIVNTKTMSLNMGEAKFIEDKIIFNVTPSPGASTCLRNAEDDTQQVITFFGGKYSFDQQRYKKDFYGEVN